MKHFFEKVLGYFIAYTVSIFIIDFFSGSSFTIHFIVGKLLQGLVFAIGMTLLFGVSFKERNGKSVLVWRNYILVILPMIIILLLLFYFSMRSNGAGSPITAIIGAALLTLIFVICLFYPFFKRKEQ